jgi:2-dehydropantoate 2-reductase
MGLPPYIDSGPVRGFIVEEDRAMRIVVVGAGAVGGLLGALMARAGHAVSFVARGMARAEIADRGLVVTTPEGSFSSGALAAFEDPSDLAVPGGVDLVVVCVKAWQVASIAPSLAPLVGERTAVLPLQNGVEAAEHLAGALGESAVVGGLCHVLATREGPARIRVMGQPLHVTLGERGARGAAPSARVGRFAEALRGAGATVSESPDIRAAVWTKLAFVEPLGSVGAVTRATIDVVRSLPETRAMLEAAMREVQAVAAGQGVTVPDEAILKGLARVDSLPAGATASMHRDLVDGRPSELDDQTGAVVRIGEKAGVARPLHDFLWASLLPQDPRLSACRTCRT